MFSKLDPTTYGTTTDKRPMEVQLWGSPRWSDVRGWVWRTDFPSVLAMQTALRTCDPTLNMVRFLEGAEMIKKQYQAVVRRLSSLVPDDKLQTDVYGDSCDVGAYLSGDPEHWTRREPARLRKGLDPTGPLRLVIQHATADGGLKALVNRGALALALAWILERYGRPCEIIACNAGHWHTHNSATKAAHLWWTVRVKAMGQPLNLQTMAYSIASPEMETRVYRFNARLVGNVLSGGLGGIESVPVGNPEDSIELFHVAPWATPENIAAQCFKMLRNQGVEMELKK